MREAAAAFIHARDVGGSVARQITSDLDIANEGIGVAHIYRGVPRGAVISGKTDLERANANGEVVPGNVHGSKVGRGGIVVSPARLSIVFEVVVNAEMGPAIRVCGIGGLVPAKAEAAAAPIDKDSKPSLAWLVVQSNGVAQRIGEGALTGGLGEAGERGAAVFGDRCARDIDGVCRDAT